MTPTRVFSASVGSFAAVLGLATAIAALSLSATTPTYAMQKHLSADGDSCTVRTGVPGTEKDGECCATADPKDCVIILKPFPSVAASRMTFRSN